MRALALKQANAGALSASRDEGHHSWISLASQQEMSAPSCSRCITLSCNLSKAKARCMIASVKMIQVSERVRYKDCVARPSTGHLPNLAWVVRTGRDMDRQYVRRAEGGDSTSWRPAKALDRTDCVARPTTIPLKPPAAMSGLTSHPRIFMMMTIPVCRHAHTCQRESLTCMASLKGQALCLTQSISSAG